jgi:hypothetical protein
MKHGAKKFNASNVARRTRRKTKAGFSLRSLRVLRVTCPF